MTEITFPCNKTKRKHAIIKAALICFLQYGYSKTSMDDIAKQANLSRPLLYLNFKNKEDLYIAVIDSLIEGRLEKVELIVNSDLSKKDKLIEFYEVFMLDVWSKVIGHPRSEEFYRVFTCSNLNEKFRNQKLEFLKSIFPDNEPVEVFMLAVEGLKSDLPDVQTLRSRLITLIDHFI